MSAADMKGDKPGIALFRTRLLHRLFIGTGRPSILISEENLSLLRREVSPCGLTGDANEIAQVQAPESHRPVVSTRDDPATVFRKSDMFHTRLVPSQDDGRRTRMRRIPETDRSIFAT